MINQFLFAYHSPLFSVSCSLYHAYRRCRPTDSAKQFYEQLRDEANKPRGGNLLRTVAFAVFGLCNSLYADHFNVVGRKLNTWMARLGAARLLKLGVGDESADQDVAFREWSKLFWAALEDKERKLRARELEGVDDESVVDEDNDDEGDDAEPLVRSSHCVLKCGHWVS